jgi:hypothetical protein
MPAGRIPPPAVIFLPGLAAPPAGGSWNAGSGRAKPPLPRSLPPALVFSAAQLALAATCLLGYGVVGLAVLRRAGRRPRPVGRGRAAAGEGCGLSAHGLSCVRSQARYRCGLRVDAALPTQTLQRQ